MEKEGYTIMEFPPTKWWIKWGNLRIAITKDFCWFHRFMMRLCFGWEFERAKERE